MGFVILLTKNALKDQEIVLRNPILKKQVLNILNTLKTNPFEISQSFETLKGNLKGYYSRRVDRCNRVVYSVDSITSEITIYSLLNHYDNI